MGHSNGAVSLTEFYAKLQREGKTDLVAGAVYSSARNGARFDNQIQNRFCFWHMKRRLPQINELQLAQGIRGAAQQQHPAPELHTLTRRGGASQDFCSSGFHRFYGAGAQAYLAIESFVLKP